MLPSNVMSFVRKMVAPSGSNGDSSDTKRSKRSSGKMSKLRQITSGISLSTGSKETSTPAPPRQETDLSHLTPEEQTILQRVFEKQERFEKEEAIRASQGRGPEAKVKGRTGRASSACRICLKSLMPGEPYSHCAECKGNVCEDCGSYTSQDTAAEADAGFMCSICRRKLARANRAAEEPLDSAEEEQTPTSPPDAASPEAAPVSAPRVTWAAGVGAAVVPIIAVVSAEHASVGEAMQKPEGNGTATDGRKSARKSAENWARLSNSVQKERRPSDAWVKLTAAAKERRSSEVSNRLVATQDKNRRHSERYDRTPLLEKERAIGISDNKDKGQKAQNQNQKQNTQEASERLKAPAADKERRLSDSYRYPVSTEESMLTIPHQPERRASDTCVRLSAPADQDGRSPDRLGAPPDKERSVSDTCVRQSDKDRRGSEAWDRLIAPQSQPRDRRASEALSGTNWGDKLSAPQAQTRRVSEQWDKQLSTPQSQERRASEVRDKMPTPQLQDRRASEHRNGLITPQSQERRVSEQWGDKLVTPQVQERKTSEQWDRLPMPQSQDRRASDAGVRQSVSSDFNKRPSDVYDQLMAPPLPNRRASDISIRSSAALTQDVQSSETWDNRLSTPQDKDRRASETWNRVPAVQEQRVPDTWDRQPVVSEQQRYSADTWQQQSGNESRSMESWDRLAPAATDRERRASESWQRVPPPIEPERRPSDAWNRPVAPGSERLMATDWEKPLTDKDRRASDTWDRFRALEEIQRRSAANSLEQERSVEMWDTPVVEVSAAEDKPKRRPSDPWSERRPSDPWESQRRDSWDMSRRSSDAWEFERGMSEQWDSDRRDSELWEGLPVPEIVRRLSDTGPTREKIDIPEQPRRLSDTGPPGHRISIAAPDRRMSVFAPPWEKGPRLQRRVSEVATTWDRSKLFRGRRMSEFAGPCGGMLDRDNSLSGFRALLRQAQSDSMQDILSPGSPTSRGGRGSSASESSGPEGEGPCDDEDSWRRRRSRVKRRTRSQRRSCDESPERPESMDQGSGPTRSTGGSGGMARHSAWESAAQARRRSSGSSELSDAGPEPIVPPIPPRRDSQARINGFRPMKLHHSLRQRSLRKQPPAIFVDDGDEYDAEQSAATLESSPSPDRPVRTQLLRRMSRGDTRQMLSDSEAMQDERAPEILDLLKPRRSWPEAVPSGMELQEPQQNEMHHGRSLVDMLRGQAPAGGYVIPRQPRSGLPHDLSVDEGGNPRADHDGIRIVIDDVDNFGTRTRKFSTVRKVTLRRDVDDGHRTRALGMRVVGGKVDGHGQLYAHVVWTVPDGQAEQMGITKGDRVLAWNGESLVGRTFEEANTIMDRMMEIVELTIEHFTEGSHLDSGPQETHRRPKPRPSDTQGLSDSNIPSSEFPQQHMPRRRLPKTPVRQPEIAQGSVMGQVQIQLWYAHDKGDLVVTILGACSLNPRNGTPGCIPPNAYVKIRLLPLGEKSSFKTPLAEPSFTPIWNASFIFANTSADDISESQLEVTIWDYYPDRDNEFLGETIIALRRADLEDKPTWYKLHEHRVRRSNPTLTPYTPAPPPHDPVPPQAPPPSHSQPPPSAAARRIAMRRAGFQHSRSLSDEKDELEDLETGSLVKSSSVDWSMLHPDYGWDPNKRRRSSSSSEREHSAPESYRTPPNVARGTQDVLQQTTYSSGTTSSASGAVLQKTGSQDEQDGTDGNGGRSRNKTFKMCRQDTPNGGAAGGSDHRRKFSQKVKKFSRSLSLKSDKRPVLGGSSGDGPDPNAAAAAPAPESQEFMADFLVSPPGIPTSKWAAASSLENPSDEGSDSAPGREEQYSAEDEPPPLPLGPGQVAPRGLQYANRTEEMLTRGEIRLAIIMSKGQLEVEVISARGLPLNASAQPPDTYVKTYLKEGERRIQKKKTRVVRHATEPVYRQTLRYSGCDVLGRTILVMVWERQKGFHNQGVGLAQIQLNNLDLSKVTTGWYNLYPMTKLPSDSDST